MNRQMARRHSAREIWWARWRSPILHALLGLWIGGGLYVGLVMLLGLASTH